MVLLVCLEPHECLYPRRLTQVRDHAASLVTFLPTEDEPTQVTQLERNSLANRVPSPSVCNFTFRYLWNNCPTQRIAHMPQRTNTKHEHSNFAPVHLEGYTAIQLRKQFCQNSPLASANMPQGRQCHVMFMYTISSLGLRSLLMTSALTTTFNISQ
jgi:hypothetical protein